MVKKQQQRKKTKVTHRRRTAEWTPPAVDKLSTEVSNVVNRLEKILYNKGRAPVIELSDMKSRVSEALVSVAQSYGKRGRPRIHA